MIFRALFAIGLVTLLAPHEPDLGLGRPGAGASQPSPAAILASAASGLSQQGTDCGTRCAGGLGALSFLHLDSASVLARLHDVRDQIAADRHARGNHAI